MMPGGVRRCQVRTGVVPQSRPIPPAAQRLHQRAREGHEGRRRVRKVDEGRAVRDGQHAGLSAGSFEMAKQGGSFLCVTKAERRGSALKRVAVPRGRERLAGRDRSNAGGLRKMRAVVRAARARRRHGRRPFEAPPAIAPAAGRGARWPGSAGQGASPLARSPQEPRNSRTTSSPSSSRNARRLIPRPPATVADRTYDDWRRLDRGDHGSRSVGRAGRCQTVARRPQAAQEPLGGTSETGRSGAEIDVVGVSTREV